MLEVDPRSATMRAMDLLDLQIPKPKNWIKFEELCHALFAEIWGDPLAQRNGRTGQQQHGVDVFGRSRRDPAGLLGVQCKGKDDSLYAAATTQEFDRELAKADHFQPTLSGWTLATTAADDASLQEHARKVSQARTQAGTFPVDILGWESLQALLARHPRVVRQFYPGLHLGRTDGSVWEREAFEVERDLGPALLGRPLGPADAVACPELPEVEAVWQELRRGFSARIVGGPGHGKSVCALQVARRAHDLGWRVVRLADSSTDRIQFPPEEGPTLHIIDDAHLSAPHALRLAEERTVATCWLLSAHTISSEIDAVAGAITVNPSRAVKTIARKLRENLDQTARVVQRIDDHVGDGIGYTSIEDRIKAAEEAQFPWQFSFILGGGWRRAAQSVESARAAQADLVLAAAAIRQLVSRDAKCGAKDLSPLLDAAGIAPEAGAKAIEWLVRERLLLTPDDLRCPHQRLSAVLIGRVLEGQTPEGRRAVAAMVERAIDDPDYTLLGVNVLLSEFSTSSSGFRWTGLIGAGAVSDLIARCWEAAPEDRAGACWTLSTLQTYLDKTWPSTAIGGHEALLAEWIARSASRACYAVGYLLNQLGSRDRDLATRIIDMVDPRSMGRRLTSDDALFASDIAGMLWQMASSQSDIWRAGVLDAVDRPKLLSLLGGWPDQGYVSTSTSTCLYFLFLDEAFGLDLVEALIPAIADRMRADPVEASIELHDLLMMGLRFIDTLGIFKDKGGPTKRMREVGNKLAKIWDARDLADKISGIERRDFQAAGRLLLFLREAAPRLFERVVSQLDWACIDRTIGDAWRLSLHEIEVFLHIGFQAKSARSPIVALIRQNLPRVGTLSARLAMLAPEVAIEELDAGRVLGLSDPWRVEWRLTAGLIASVATPRPELVETAFRPHEAKASEELSNKMQPFFGGPLLCLRFLQERAPASFERIIAGIDVDTAAIGWEWALKGLDANGKASSPRDEVRNARRTAAWLVEQCLSRSDRIGALARSLRKRVPAKSRPQASDLKPFKWR